MKCWDIIGGGVILNGVVECMLQGTKNILKMSLFYHNLVFQSKSNHMEVQNSLHLVHTEFKELKESHHNHTTYKPMEALLDSQYTNKKTPDFNNDSAKHPVTGHTGDNVTLILLALAVLAGKANSYTHGLL